MPSRSNKAGSGGVTVAAVAAVAVAASPTFRGHSGSFPLVSPLLVSSPQMFAFPWPDKVTLKLTGILYEILPTMASVSDHKAPA